MTHHNTEEAGGTRYSGGKPGHFWCAPVAGLREVARVSEYGADKYAPFDWDMGQSFSTLMDCTFRHLIAMASKGPMAMDSESKCLHAAHAAWNLLALLSFVEQGRSELDDVTKWIGISAEEKDDVL